MEVRALIERRQLLGYKRVVRAETIPICSKAPIVMAQCYHSLSDGIFTCL